MTAAEAAGARPRSSLRKVVAASMIGTTIEWYDFFLYGSAAALVFGKLFFPEGRPADRDACWPSPPMRWGSWPGRWAGWSSATSATGSGASSS